MLPASLGRITKHDVIDEWVQSEPVRIESLGGHEFRFVFDESVLAEGDADFGKAIANLLRPGNLLAQAEPYVLRYFEDTMRMLADEAPLISIAEACDVWRHVEFADSIHVHRTAEGVFLSVGGNCAWEIEHGLRLVFRDGLTITKVGMSDGHLTNPEGLVYR